MYKTFTLTHLNGGVSIDKFENGRQVGWGMVYPDELRRLMIEVALLIAEGYNIGQPSRQVLRETRDRIVHEHLEGVL